MMPTAVPIARPVLDTCLTCTISFTKPDLMCWCVRVWCLSWKGFEQQRSGALVATTTAAPESCALYLGSEVWGTGATEGTKLKVMFCTHHFVFAFLHVRAA